jgi:hypothetical protein
MIDSITKYFPEATIVSESPQRVEFTMFPPADQDLFVILKLIFNTNKCKSYFVEKTADFRLRIILTKD